MSSQPIDPRNIDLPGSSTEEAFFAIAAVAQEIGFKFCSYGVRIPIPITRPRTTFLSNYPPDWLSIYRERKYVDIDPIVAHGMRSSEPVVWSDESFSTTPDLWKQAREHGIHHGWAMSRRDSDGAFGMLVLARGEPAITKQELREKEWRMRQLADVSHVAIKSRMGKELPSAPKLSDREIDILRWTADGKTASEIATIIDLSERTVNFHINQAVSKLDASNKISAAVRAAMNGLLW